MKKLLFSFVFVCALAVSSFGQSASDCTISGNLYDSFNDPLVGFTFTATVTRRDGVPVAYSPKTVTTTSGGAISFTVPRKSFVLIRGSFTVGRYDFRNGLLMFIPDEASKAIPDLLLWVDRRVQSGEKVTLQWVDDKECVRAQLRGAGDDPTQCPAIAAYHADSLIALCALWYADTMGKPEWREARSTAQEATNW